MSTTALLGSNRFTDCRTLIAWRGHSLLEVELNPLRVTLRTPRDQANVQRLEVVENQLREAPDQALDAVQIIAAPPSVAIFWKGDPLVIALQLDAAQVRVRLDLRPLGLNVFNDGEHLMVGGNSLVNNVVEQCETAVGIG